MDTRKRICTESWPWEKNPLPHRGIEPASAAWQFDALTNWATSPRYHTQCWDCVSCYRSWPIKSCIVYEILPNRATESDGKIVFFTVLRQWCNAEVEIKLPSDETPELPKILSLNPDVDKSIAFYALPTARNMSFSYLPSWVFQHHSSSRSFHYKTTPSMNRARLLPIIWWIIFRPDMSFAVDWALDIETRSIGYSRKLRLSL